MSKLFVIVLLFALLHSIVVANIGKCVVHVWSRISCNHVFPCFSFFSVFTEVPSDTVVAEGSQAQLKCVFTSINTASVTWERDEVLLLPSERIVITSNGLTITETQDGDEGTYSCIVTDQVDSITETRNADLDFACEQYIQPNLRTKDTLGPI